jgi:hypothetical protein
MANYFYTINFLFDEGNYTDQRIDRSVKSALMNWADNYEVDLIKVNRNRFRESIRKAVNEENQPLKTPGLVNVWRTVIDLDGRQGIINIVETETR